jgi:hypothetical protein
MLPAVRATTAARRSWFRLHDAVIMATGSGLLCEGGGLCPAARQAFYTDGVQTVCNVARSAHNGQAPTHRPSTQAPRAGSTPAGHLLNTQRQAHEPDKPPRKASAGISHERVVVVVVSGLCSRLVTAFPWLGRPRAVLNCITAPRLAAIYTQDPRRCLGVNSGVPKPSWASRRNLQWRKPESPATERTSAR